MFQYKSNNDFLGGVRCLLVEKQNEECILLH